MFSMNAERRRYLLNMLWLLIFPLTWLSTVFAQNNPAFIENVYSTFLYPLISGALPFQYLPYFSFFEIILGVGSIVVLGALVLFSVRLFRGKGGRVWRVLKTLQKVFIVCGVCYFLFYFLWGYNYYRHPYSVIAGLPEALSTKEELYALCVDLVGKANDARGALSSHEEGTPADQPSVADLQEKTRLAYTKAKHDKIAGISGVTGFAKPIAISRLVSYTGITGIYFPYTGEANFNNDVPVLDKGAVLCHEMAHRQGFAREDEANFIAFVVCANSDDAYLRYSGYFLAVTHAMSQLYRVDAEAYHEVYSRYSPEIIADINANRAYWRMFEGDVARTFTQINDTYLKTHNLSDGVQSYGRMVDLMLAQRRILSAKTDIVAVYSASRGLFCLTTSGFLV
ncbi:MAG: DUF3810 domain-containing protein [Peptococcaceae bacterium]|nr:DUF3810 domain-containing protein [Peptococcaceae bacterium]